VGPIWERLVKNDMEMAMKKRWTDGIPSVIGLSPIEFAILAGLLLGFIGALVVMMTLCD